MDVGSAGEGACTLTWTCACSWELLALDVILCRLCLAVPSFSLKDLIVPQVWLAACVSTSPTKGRLGWSCISK